MASTTTATTTTTTIHDNNRQQQLLQKLIQRKKLDLMNGQIVKIETKLYQCQTKFDDELSTMWQNHRNLVRDKGMPTTLSNLIEQRFINITNRWEDILWRPIEFPPDVFLPFCYYNFFIFQSTIYRKKARNALHLLVYLL
jgi:hypothetical protein